MKSDDRAKLAPPQQCRACYHFEAWRVDGVERHQCLRGQPMHQGCWTFRQKDGA